MSVAVALCATGAAALLHSNGALAQGLGRTRCILLTTGGGLLFALSAFLVTLSTMALRVKTTRFVDGSGYRYCERVGQLSGDMYQLSDDLETQGRFILNIGDQRFIGSTAPQASHHQQPMPELFVDGSSIYWIPGNVSSPRQPMEIFCCDFLGRITPTSSMGRLVRGTRADTQ